MKSLLFLITISFLSCKSRTNNQASNQAEIVTNYSFKGISIFQKNATRAELETRLKAHKTSFFDVSSEGDDILVFGIPFVCCMNKQVLYIPDYYIGDLLLKDIFLIFQDSNLVLIRSEILRNENLYKDEPIKDFKSLFQQKYGKGIEKKKDSVSDDGITIRIEKELMTNKSDSIQMVFEEYKEIDSVRVFDRLIPRNNEVIRINSARQSFREKISKSKPPKVAKPIAGLRTDWPYSYYPLTTVYFSFEMTFPNRLQECCDLIRNKTTISDSTIIIKRRKQIMDSL